MGQKSLITMNEWRSLFMFSTGKGRKRERESRESKSQDEENDKLRKCNFWQFPVSCLLLILVNTSTYNLSCSLRSYCCAFVFCCENLKIFYFRWSYKFFVSFFQLLIFFKQPFLNCNSSYSAKQFSIKSSWII